MTGLTALIAMTCAAAGMGVRFCSYSLHVALRSRLWSAGTGWRPGATGGLSKDGQGGLEVHLATNDA